jgi:Short C-terminal domain
MWQRRQPGLIRSPPVAEDSDARASGGGESGPRVVPEPPAGARHSAVRGSLGSGLSAHARRIWVWAILALATLLAVLAIFAIWANRQLLSPSNWASTSTELLQKPTIRTALSSYLIDQLYANVDVSGEIKSGLPKQLAPLAGPISGALHTVAEEATKRALATPQVQNVWRRANLAADQTLVAIVNGGGRRVQINGGTVSLNLRQIVADLARRLGLPADIAAKLPASVANLKVVTSKQLGLVRNLAKALHALAVALITIVCGLYALALWLARGHRRRTLMWIGSSLVLAGLVVLIARSIAQGQLVGAITSDASIQPAAGDAYSVATSLLVQVAGASIIIGLPVIAAAWLAGPARWAIAARRFWAPHLRERPALAYWITAGLLALLFIWGPIPSTRNPLTMLLYTVLAFVGAHVLAAQIAEEFPDAPAVSVRAALGQYGHAVGGTIARARAAAAPSAAAAGPSPAAELERLVALLDRGAITAEEYAAAKRRLFASP